PIINRLLHAVLVRSLADLRAGIVPAIGDDRPAVILAGLRNIDLVAAARAVFDGPELAALRMDRGALRIAVPVRPDFRPHAFLADERIALGHRAVRRDAHHLAEMTGEILRRLQRIALAER